MQLGKQWSSQSANLWGAFAQVRLAKKGQIASVGMIISPYKSSIELLYHNGYLIQYSSLWGMPVSSSGLYSYFMRRGVLTQIRSL